MAHLDLDTRVISVVQKAWRGHIERPKTEAGYRHFAISAQLADHLRASATPSSFLAIACSMGGNVGGSFEFETSGRGWPEFKGG